MRATIFFLLCICSAAMGQNLVPNPGFEQTKDTIHGFTDNSSEFLSTVDVWITPNTASPDLIGPDFEERYINHPAPHSGTMMVGIQAKPDWTEYIGISLTEALTPNRTYSVSYWIRRAECISPKMNKDQEMNDHFGILFAPDPIETDNARIMTGTPQITADTTLLITDKEWVKISKYFTPKEKYSMLYLGQFKKKGEAPVIMTGYYVIDDVEVKVLSDYEALDKGATLPVGSIIPLNNVNFLSGTTEFSNKKSYDILKDLTDYLNSNTAIRIRINGHTDAKGSKQSNLSLSEQRAKTIAQRLIQNGIAEGRIDWKGFGEDSPVADNKTAAGRAKNRRVEFEVIE